MTVYENDALQAPGSGDRGVRGAAGQATVEVSHNLADIARELGVTGGAGLHGVAKRQEWNSVGAVGKAKVKGRDYVKMSPPLEVDLDYARSHARLPRSSANNSGHHDNEARYDETY